jgi:hypothetical protein
MVDDLYVFATQDLPGLHVAANDLRKAFELLEPVAAEIVRRSSGIGVSYFLDETLAGFQTRLMLLRALREEPPKLPADTVVARKFLSQRRLARILSEIAARELGKRDQHAAYWRAQSGLIFSVMAPMMRTQSGTLLYSEAYARDLLTRIAGSGQSGADSEAASSGRPADLVLHLAPV